MQHHSRCLKEGEAVLPSPLFIAISNVAIDNNNALMYTRVSGIEPLLLM
jgi:hypothetical protein